MHRFFRLPPSAQMLARDIDDEIAFHIEQRVAALESQGLSAADARRRAEMEFGDVSSARAELRAIDRGTHRRMTRAFRWDALRQDVAASLRGMRRNPAFTFAVVVTLALGVGVNAAMFGITDRLLLSAPPHIADADDVVRVLYEHSPPGGRRTQASLPWRDYELLRTSGAFAEVGAFFTTNAVLGRGVGAAELRLGEATATFFPVLGVQPALGRFFSAEEDAIPDGRAVVVLSHSLWQTRFGGDAGVLGRSVEIDHRRYEVIGVAPRGFHGVNLEPVDVWAPVSALGASMGGEEWYVSGGPHYLQAVARLRDGEDPAVARDRATTAFLAGNEERFADDHTAGVVLSPVIAARAPDVAGGTPHRSGRIALLLLGVSLLVVLIACVNVINLLLARGMRQRREIGVRLALGISRARLAAQMMTETLAQAAAGAALGLLLAHWTGRIAFIALLPGLESSGSVVSGRVVLFAMAVTLACALAAGIAPVIHSGRSHATDLLGMGGRTTYRRSIVRSGLVALQATLSVVLLVGAGLFLRSLREAGDIALGYEPDRVASFTWHTTGLDWDAERTRALYDAALARVEALPQVDAAALTMTQPLWSSLFAYPRVPGLDSIPTTRDIIYSPVSPDYFRTVGAHLVQGRPFTNRDVTGSPPVTVVTESLARVLWPRETAVGKCFMTSSGADAACREVVGVVEDTRYTGVLDAPTLMFYLPMAQSEPRGSLRSLLVRLRGDADAGIAQVRGALQELEPGLPHVSAQLLEERVAPALQPWRLGAVMFTAFGILALSLASLGLYGVVAYDVAQRRRELGVRIALGARAVGVLRMVVGEALRIVIVGTSIGVIASIGAARWIQPLLFDVSARDPFIHTTVVLLLLILTLLAAALPAWRAARVHPTEALRDD